MERNLKSDKYQFDADVGLLIREVKQHKGTFYTSLSGNYHIVRESIYYGVGLMYANPEKNAPVVAKLIEQVCAIEDCDVNSRTYGVWPLYMEEPVQTRKRPDWNWSDFCAKGLLQFIIDYGEYFEPELIDKIKYAVTCAAEAIMKRDVNPSYTNISVMGSYVTLAVGEYIGNTKIAEYAKERFRKLFQFNVFNGCVSEYNSPTYTIEALTDLSLIKKHIHDAEISEMVQLLLDMQWKYTMEHFCAENGQWTGPHSRCYETLQGNRLKSFLQLGLGDRYRLISDSELEVEPMWVQSDLEIPQQYVSYVSTCGVQSIMRHNVLNDEISIWAQLWRDGEASLGSFNFCDFWTQRRPVIAYWGKEEPYYMRIRLMHDDFDLASGMLTTSQFKNVVVGAVGLCNDHGDRHFCMDPIEDNRIKAKYLAVRFEFGGKDINKTLKGIRETENGVIVEFDGVTIPVYIGRCAFGDIVPEIVIVRENDIIAVDIIWHSSEQEEFVMIDAGKKAYSAFGIGIFPQGIEAAIEMFDKISEAQSSITYNCRYSAYAVKYSEKIASYKEISEQMMDTRKHNIVPSRHIWRVPSRTDLGES